MLMTRWELRIVPCLAGGNASATCLKMLVMHFVEVPLSLHSMFKAQYKCEVIIIIITTHIPSCINFFSPASSSASSSDTLLFLVDPIRFLCVKLCMQ